MVLHDHLLCETESELLCGLGLLDQLHLNNSHHGTNKTVLYSHISCIGIGLDGSLEGSHGEINVTITLAFSATSILPFKILQSVLGHMLVATRLQISVEIPQQKSVSLVVLGITVTFDSVLLDQFVSIVLHQGYHFFRNSYISQNILGLQQTVDAALWDNGSSPLCSLGSLSGGLPGRFPRGALLGSRLFGGLSTLLSSCHFTLAQKEFFFFSEIRPG